MKKLFASVMMIFLLVVSVNAVKDFEITSAEFDETSYGVGDTINLVVTLTNTGDEPTGFIVNEDILMEDAPFSFEINGGGPVQSIPASGNSVVTLVHTVDLMQHTGIYNGTMSSYLNDNNTINDNFLLSTSIDLNEDVDATLTTAPDVIVGFADDIMITITNKGNDDISFDGDIDSIEYNGNIILLSACSYSGVLGYEDTVDITCTVDVPEIYPAGLYTGTFDYTYGVDSTGSLSVAVNVVDVINQLTVTLAPNTAELIRNLQATDTVTMKIKNTGNVALNDLNLELETLMSDSYELNAAGINPSGTFDLAVNEERTIVITFTMPSDWSSTTGTLTYTGDLTVNDGDTVLDTEAITVVLKDPSTSLSFSSVEIGDSGQDRNVAYSGTFSVQNTGDTSITNIALTTVNIGSKYEFVFDSYPSTISAGNVVNVGFSMLIPESQDAGRKKIGSISFKSNQINRTADVYVTTGTNLEIKSLQLKLKDDSYDEVCDDDQYSCDGFDIEPGRKLYVKLDLDNTLPDGEKSSDNKIEDVEFTVTIFGIDGEDEDDIDKDSSKFDIKSDSHNDEVLEITLPDKFPDQESFTMEITASGSVKNGPDMELPQTITLELNNNRENEDVRIIDAYLSPSKVTCDREATLRVTIANYGTDTLDEARIVAYSEDLDFLDREYTNIDLDSDPYANDNEFTATYRVNVPANYNGNIAKFTVWAFHGTSDSDYENWDDHIRELSLSVGNCGDDVTTTRMVTTTTQSTIVTFDDSNMGDNGNDEYYYDTTEVPFTETPTYIAILALTFLVVLGIVITMIIKALKN